MRTQTEPMLDYPHPPFPIQHQPMPGKTAAINPAPDHGETSYKGSGRLNGKKAVITGGDSGIGRAVAIAYAREGADVLISYLNEHDDARETERLVTEAGRKAVLLPGDIQDPVNAAQSSQRPYRSLAESISSSITRPIRPASNRSMTSATRNGN